MQEPRMVFKCHKVLSVERAVSIMNDLDQIAKAWGLKYPFTVVDANFDIYNANNGKKLDWIFRGIIYFVIILRLMKNGN